jgi:hypothetical protein
MAGNTVVGRGKGVATGVARIVAAAEPAEVSASTQGMAAAAEVAAAPAA